MRFLLLLIIITSTQSFDRTDVLRLYKQKKYKLLEKMYGKYPSFFRGNNEATLMGRAFLRLKKYREATSVCAPLVLFESSRSCRKILKNAEKKSPEDYHIGLGDYYLKSQDYRKAFLKYNEVLNKDEGHVEARVKVLQTLIRMGYMDYAQEQIWIIEEKHSSVARIQDQIDSSANSYRILFRRFKDKEIPAKHNDNLYMHVFLDQLNQEKMIAQLKKHFSDLEAMKGFSQRNAVRLGNVIFIEKEYKKLDQYLKEIGEKIVNPLYRLSYLALKFRLSKVLKPGTKLISKKPEPKQPENEAFTRAVAEIPQNLQGPMDYVAPNLKPINTSDLKFATPSDTSAYSKVYKEFNQRMEGANEYEKRHLYKQIDDIASELENNPNTSETYETYVGSREGKEFQQKMLALEEQLMKRDKENVYLFKDENKSFDDAMEKAETKKDKIRVLQNFMGKWENIAYGDDVDLVAQGALRAYYETPEGVDLARKVYSVVDEYKLIPKELMKDQDLLDQIRKIGF